VGREAGEELSHEVDKNSISEDDLSSAEPTTVLPEKVDSSTVRVRTVRRIPDRMPEYP
jgi:hypothetical protein